MRTPNNKKTSQQLEILLQQQAEKIAQLEREQAIEAAIERIRASALTMHHSHEVKDVANVMRKELMGLGLEGISAATIWIEQTKGKVRAWDFTNVQEASDSKDLNADIILDLEKGRAHPKAYFWNIWDKKETYWVVESNKETLYASMNWLVELDETMGKEMLHLVDTGQLTYWWHASAAIKKGTITIDFVAPPPVEMAIILPKMATAFDLAYRRFEDLQKAEAQTREAQIEVALERVRARTMAMHKTEDLRAVVGVLYEQFNLLHLADEGCNINIFKKDINSIETWMAGFDGISLPDCYYMEGIGHPFLKRMWETWKAQAAPFHITSAGKELNDYAKYILEETDLKRIPDDFKKMMLASPELHFSFITFKYGQIELVNSSAFPSQENLQVLTRFAKVFEQSYTRFLDLQKAEAQAKEAQIETALERVRSRTMAMHKTEDLREVVGVLYEQVGLLNLADTGCNINIFKEAHINVIETWMAGFDGVSLPECYYGEAIGHPSIKRAWKKWKAQAAPFHISLAGKALHDYTSYLLEETDLKRIPDDFKELMLSIPKAHFSYITFKYGQIQIVNSSAPPSPENLGVLTRFAKVFEQTYTRFLDIQKAEAQAKEAQIEAALERVRSASMAMHNSAEMQQVVQVMFEQMQAFGISSHATLIEIFDAENGLIDCWFADHLNSYHITHYEIRGKKNHTIRKMWTCWKEQQPSMTIHLKGAKKKKYDTYLLTETGFNQIPDALKKDIRSSKEGYFTYCSMRYGLIQVVDIHPIPAENIAIIQRFAKVFEQSYTRFLDIQKAETQAKEAQIEAALERVRSKSMAMHKSDELREVVATVYQQLNGLGFGAYGCAIVTDEKERNGYNMWMANTNQNLLPTVYFMPHFEHPLYDQFVSGYQSKVPFFTVELKGQLKKSYDKIVFSETDFKNLPAEIKQMMQSHEESYACSANFEQGFLQTQGLEPLPEDKAVILQRFARVFEQSYVRFLDLQKAEAQAREAQIEAALERVRARSMAMHKSDELRSVIGVVLHQLNKLGMDAYGTGLILFDKKDKSYTVWLAGFEVDDYAQSYRVPYFDHPYYNAQFNAWNHGKQYENFLFEGDLKKSYDAFVLEHSDFRHLPALAKETIMAEASFVNCCAYMRYGMLSLVVEGTTSIPRADAVILQRFAKVFEQTYTRFLDIQKAEAQAKEAQIEAAMERVRSAAMAMHKSEELKEVVAVIFEELKKQGFPTYLCSIGIYDAETKGSNWWSFMEEQDGLPASYHMPYLNGRWFKEAYEVWKNQIPFHLIELVGEEQEEHTRLCFEETGIKDFPEEAKAALREADKHGIRAAYVSMTHGLIEITTEESLKESQIQLLQRFTKVIDLTYTRVADLQQAETQAREAQIEAALERVRAASMAMHHSNELMEVTNMLFEQMHNIGLKAVSSWISLINVEADALEMWLRHEESEIAAQIVSGKDHPNFRADIDAWKNKDASIKFADDKADFIFAMKHLFGFEVDNHPDKSHFHLLEVYHRFGWLGLGTWDESTAEEIEICNRFANVFEQTYTRFLDLKKAEERAREAQIEAALERVRARAMAMRHSDELSKAAELLYHEFFKLGVEPYSCGYLINDEEKEEWKIWLTNPGEPFFKQYWTIPYTADHNLQARYESWKNKEDFHCAVLEGAANQAHHQVICQYAPWKEEVTDNLAPQLVFNSAHFSLGHLLVISPDRLSSELEQAMVRFASVFDLTYRRFLDLEKAEEQNRQLEKVFNENQRLLHSILPEQIAEQIRAGQQTIVKRFEQVSILFADIVGFTILSEKITPQEVVDILNGLFSRFDDLTDKYQLEKIKTIGDAYMVAAGVPEEKDNHAQLMFAFAKEMLQTLQAFNQAMGGNLKIRIGISSGPVVAGVIGKKKFAYDLWGDTVNTAARMEANGRADCIQVSPTTYAILKKETAFEKIPNVEIKGKGKMDVYLWAP